MTDEKLIAEIRSVGDRASEMRPEMLHLDHEAMKLRERFGHRSQGEILAQLIKHFQKRELFWRD